MELEPQFSGKGIGAQVVGETIAVFASDCRIVACLPFPLQYQNWQDDEHKAMREQPGFEFRRKADFARVPKFWLDLGFRKFPDCDFYSSAPELTRAAAAGEYRATPPIQDAIAHFQEDNFRL